MIEAAADPLRTALNGHDTDWQRKARAIAEFAVEVSEAVMTECNFPANSEQRQKNKLAEIMRVEPVNDLHVPNRIYLYENEDGPWGVSLILIDMSPILSTGPDPAFAHELFFCSDGHVVDCDDSKIMDDMTYRGAGRLVVLYLAKKISHIVRENERERVGQLPDIYNEVTTLFNL